MVDGGNGRDVIPRPMPYHHPLHAVLQLPRCVRQKPGMTKHSWRLCVGSTNETYNANGWRSNKCCSTGVSWPHFSTSALCPLTSFSTSSSSNATLAFSKSLLADPRLTSRGSSFMRPRSCYVLVPCSPCRSSAPLSVAPSCTFGREGIQRRDSAS